MKYSGYLSIRTPWIEDPSLPLYTACCPNYIQMCAKQVLNSGYLSIEGRRLGPNGVRYREVPLYSTFKGDTYVPTVLIT